MKKILFTACLVLGCANSAVAATFTFDDGNQGVSPRTSDGLTVSFAAPGANRQARFANSTFANRRGIGVRTGINIVSDTIDPGETLRVNFDTTVAGDTLTMTRWNSDEAVTITTNKGKSLQYNIDANGSGPKEVIDISSLGNFLALNITGDGTTTTTALHKISNVSAVPLPAAAWLFGSGILGLVGLARRKKAAQASSC